VSAAGDGAATTYAAAEDQIAYWNGPGGQRWLALQQKHDLLFAPLTAALFARARIMPGERVLDIGCGCGGTTIEAARRAGEAGAAVGLDVSEPILAEARRRAPSDARIEFVLADAATRQFQAGSFDAMISRLGVMFFADPLAAFANLRGALRRGGRAVIVCWREAGRNAWQMVPLRAALRHVPRLPERDPNDPGPYAFASEARVRRILEGAGFVDIAMTPLDFDLDIAIGGGIESAMHTAVGLGPASRALEGQPADKRAAATAEIRAALTPLLQGERLPLAGAIWIVEAVNR